MKQPKNFSFQMHKMPLSQTGENGPTSAGYTKKVCLWEIMNRAECIALEQCLCALL